MRGYGKSKVRSNLNKLDLIFVQMETNNTSDPDGEVPNYAADLDFARTGVGTFELTFTGTKKPYFAKVIAWHEEDDDNLRVLTSGYVSSTGKVTLATQTNLKAYATATITFTAQTNYVDDEQMIIGDGINAPVIFDFDVAGDGAGAGVAMDISGETTAADVAAVAAPLLATNLPSITVLDNLDGTITLTHKLLGSFANITITEDVVNAGHTVTGMSGGVDDAWADDDTTDKTVCVLILSSDSSQGGTFAASS